MKQVLFFLSENLVEFFHPNNNIPIWTGRRLDGKCKGPSVETNGRRQNLMFILAELLKLIHVAFMPLNFLILASDFGDCEGNEAEGEVKSIQRFSSWGCLGRDCWYLFWWGRIDTIILTIC